MRCSVLRRWGNAAAHVLRGNAETVLIFQTDSSARLRLDKVAHRQKKRRYEFRQKQGACGRINSRAASFQSILARDSAIDRVEPTIPVSASGLASGGARVLVILAKFKIGEISMGFANLS